MHHKNIAEKIYFLMVSTFLVLGCSTMAPHENFKSQLYHMIGKSIDNIPRHRWPFEEDLIESKRLPNGNIEKNINIILERADIFLRLTLNLAQ